jgi:hypothetical protein
MTRKFRPLLISSLALWHDRSQKQLAAATGIPQKRVSQLLRGGEIEDDVFARLLAAAKSNIFSPFWPEYLAELKSQPGSAMGCDAHLAGPGPQQKRAPPARQRPFHPPESGDQALVWPVESTGIRMP